MRRLTSAKNLLGGILGGTECERRLRSGTTIVLVAHRNPPDRPLPARNISHIFENSTRNACHRQGQPRAQVTHSSAYTRSTVAKHDLATYHLTPVGVFVSSGSVWRRQRRLPVACAVSGPVLLLIAAHRAEIFCTVD